MGHEGINIRHCGLLALDGSFYLPALMLVANLPASCRLFVPSQQ